MPPYPAPTQRATHPIATSPDEERTIFEITPTLAPDIALAVLTCGFGLPRLIPRAIANRGCKYKLTTQRLLLTTGLTGRHVEECELYRVQDVTTSQGALGRVLGFGTVVVHVRDVTTPLLSLTNISHPMKVKEQIREQMRQSKRNEGMRPIEFG